MSHRDAWRAGVLPALLLSFVCPAGAAPRPAQQPSAVGPAASSPSANQSDDGPVLEVGKPVERVLKGDEAHSYTLDLVANELVEAVVDQRGIDIVVTIVDPEGKQISVIDGPTGANGPEPVFVVAERAGVYRIEIRALQSKVPPGSYRAVLTARRIATEADRDHARAVANSTRPPERTPPETIGEGTAIERRIAGNGVHVHAVDLQEGQVFDVIVQQVNVDVIVRFRAPDGSIVEEVNNPNVGSSEWVWHIAKAPGTYLLELASPAPFQEGTYKLTVNGIRPPTLEEREFLDAVRLDAEAIQLRGDGKTEEAKAADAKAIGLYERTLLLHLPVKRALAGGAVDRFKLSLGDNCYLDLVVDQQGIDVVVQLVDPNGKTIAKVDSPNGANGPERLELIAEHAGTYHVEIAALEPNVTGRYTLVVRRAATATERDGLLLESRRLEREARRLDRAGRIVEAIAMVERVVELREQVFGVDSPFLYPMLNYLSVMRNIVGEYVKRERDDLRSLAIIEKMFGPEHVEVATSLTNLAISYTKRGDYAKAEAALLRAQKIFARIFGTDTWTTGMVMTNLGDCYSGWGKVEKAEACFQRALAVWEKSKGPEDGDVALALSNLASFYRDEKRLDLAETLIRRAIAINEKVRPNSATLGSDYAALGLIYMARGDNVSAGPLFERERTTLELRYGREHPDLVDNLFIQAGLHWAMGDFPAAISLLEQAEQLRDRSTALRIDVGSEREKSTLLDFFASEDDFCVSFNLKAAAGDARASRLALTSVLRRKGRVLDETSGSVAILRERADETDRAALADLAAARTLLSRRVLAGRRDLELSVFLAEVRQLVEQVEKLEGAVSSRSASFRTSRLPVTCEAVQARIPDGAELVEFVRIEPRGPMFEPSGPARYVAYVLGHTGDPRPVDLGDASAIDTAVEALRAALRDTRRSDTKRLARALDEKLMRPIRAEVGGDGTLLISPDGALNTVPFAALVDENGSFLVERYTIDYLTSGRDLLRLDRPSTNFNAALIVANPDFGGVKALAATGELATRAVDIANLRFRALPATEREAHEISALLPKATVLTGHSATVEAIKQVQSPSVLHIATHGYFLGDAVAGDRGDGSSASRIEDPLLRSGLALTGANQPAGYGDGLLTALDVAGLDLWGTKLVVLSACDTGLGEVRAGEGVYGLRRALVLAGSATQMMSLWDIDDRATRELMVGYYRELLSGAGRADALRRVQLRMLKGPKSRHPAYWAGFIVSGDWRPLNPHEANK